MTSTPFNSSTPFPSDLPISKLRVSTQLAVDPHHIGSSLDEFLAEDGLKRCPKCGETKDRSEFRKDRSRKDGLQGHCKECRQAAQASYDKTEARKAAQRRSQLKGRYGLTEEGFQALLDSQGGRCACCGTDSPAGSYGNRWHVDHCHETGKIRGLLCQSCNTGAGKFGDNLDGSLNLVDYMIRSCSTTEEMSPKLETKLAAISLKIQLLLAGVK